MLPPPRVMSTPRQPMRQGFEITPMLDASAASNSPSSSNKVQMELRRRPRRRKSAEPIRVHPPLDSLVWCWT